MTKTSADHSLFYWFLGVVCWAPLPFGSNRPWGAALLFALVSILLIWWVLLYLMKRVRTPRYVFKNALYPVLLLVVVQIWVGFQTISLPGDWVAWLSPRAAELHLPAARMALSLDVALTRFYLLQGLTYTIGFVLVLLLVTHRSRAEKLLWVVLSSGAIQAAYGVLMTLSGMEYGFFVEKYTGLGVPTGTFVNRNHLAGYLVMCLAAGVGLLLSRLETSQARSKRERLRLWLALLFNSKLVLRLMLAMMVIALVLTHSRMGNLAFFVSLCVASLALMLAQKQQISTNVLLLLASLLIVDLLIVGQWFGMDEVAERLFNTSAASESRDEVSQFTLALVLDFPWTGSGGGTFYTVFPHYSESVLSGDYYVHAHNDFLELAGNLGIPAFGCLGMFLLLTLIQALVHLRNTNSRFERAIGFVVVQVIVWLFMHGAVDFNLHVPANAFTAMILLSMAWIQINYSTGKIGKIH